MRIKKEVIATKYSNVFTLCIALIICNTLNGQPQAYGFALPPGDKEGLTNVTFQADPYFKIDSYKDYGLLYMNLNIKPSTAQKYYGSFWFNYRYRGQEWGDQSRVPHNLFNSIECWILRITIRVAGPNFMREMSYSMSDGQIQIGKVPLNTKASDYHVFIIGLEHAEFKGTSSLHQYIDALLAGENKKGYQNTTSSDNQKGINQTNNNFTKSPAGADSNEQSYNKPKEKNTDSKSEKQGMNKSSLPEFFRTSDGKYFHKEGDVIKEVSYDEYMQMKRTAANKKKPEEQSPKLSPEEQQKAIDDVIADMYANQQKQAALEKDLVEAAGKISSILFSNTKPQISREEADNFEQTERQKKKEYERQLEMQHQRVENRLQLLDKYKEIQLPTSSSKTATDSVFYIGYIPQNIRGEKATLSVTPVFAVYKYADGSWPFRTTVIRNLGPNANNCVLHGCYQSRTEAEDMRRKLIEAFQQSGGNTIDISVKTIQKPNVSGTDYWGNEQKSQTEKQITPKGKTKSDDDFWNN